MFPKSDFAAQYLAVRTQTLALTESLEIEDYLIQPMDDASPPKWHLAHVTWFFETFLLKPYCTGYHPFQDGYEVLFNSYYNGVGKQFPRARRGHLSRPTVAEILGYRKYVDDAMLVLLSQSLTDEMRLRFLLGLHHEQQHQELLLTDIKYNFGNNPLLPTFASRPEAIALRSDPRELKFIRQSAGIYETGNNFRPESYESFTFDNESPRHQVYLGDYELANRLITNGEYLAFLEDGGYRNPELWLSDAWSLVNLSDTRLDSPLYWINRDGQWFEYTLCGLEPLDLDKPVCHVSGYEADAFARWSDARLPTEAEWEVFARPYDADITTGNFVDTQNYHPVAQAGSLQLFGDLWEWTSSSYGPYPGFKEFPGQLGEYNGKFMANQLVLRGGSCVTPREHIRVGYRNFFYPKDRWQFTGIRLARDV